MRLDAERGAGLSAPALRPGQEGHPSPGRAEMAQQLETERLEQRGCNRFLQTVVGAVAGQLSIKIDGPDLKGEVGHKLQADDTEDKPRDIEFFPFARNSTSSVNAARP